MMNMPIFQAVPHLTPASQRRDHMASTTALYY